MRPYLYALPALIIAAPLAAQSEGELKSYFEGKAVVVKLDMPATDDGVDVYPTRAHPVDFGKYAKRIKAHGTAVKSGESIVVTKVKVKRDLIEFQLGGGGFGTFGDDNSTSISVPTTEKTRREKDLERDIKKEKDPEKRKAMSEELDALHKERDRQDALLKATTASAEQAKRDNVRQQALTSGSRFNLRYDGAVPASALAPASVMSALREYVSFPPQSFGGNAVAPPGVTRSEVAPTPESGQALRPSELRKGLTRAEVEAMYGKAVSTTERAEGDLKVVVSTFVHGQNMLTAEFVEDVLIRYSLSSR
jgi:hypothetical protein